MPRAPDGPDTAAHDRSIGGAARGPAVRYAIERNHPHSLPVHDSGEKARPSLTVLLPDATRATRRWPLSDRCLWLDYFLVLKS